MSTIQYVKNAGPLETLETEKSNLASVRTTTDSQGNTLSAKYFLDEHERLRDLKDVAVLGYN